MNTKIIIRKILFATLWLAIGAGMLTLLLAAISKKKKQVCRDYKVAVKGEPGQFFVDQAEVVRIISNQREGRIKDEAVASFELRKLEELLEKNEWISDAELYFDNRCVLHVTVTERKPIARVFTTAGNSFFIDSGAKRMPVTGKLAARLPVFTGFPEKKQLNKSEKKLLQHVKTTAIFINGNDFWLAQVAQIDISADNEFEMIPVVGNHLVKLGDGKGIEQKFERLMTFYKQVLNKTGFDKYSVINVQYQGQVIATKKGTGKSKQGVSYYDKQVNTVMIDKQNAKPVAIVTPTKNKANPLKASVSDNKQNEPAQKPKAVMPNSSQ
jgi:cell division protein FtsQ